MEKDFEKDMRLEPKTNNKNTPTISIQRLSPNAVLPTRAHVDDAGLDLYCLDSIRIEPKAGKVVKTGIAIALPKDHVGLVADRSSLAKQGLKTAGGIIDAGYRGEIHIVFWNISDRAIELKAKERIAQLLILPMIAPSVTEVFQLDETARGQNGFGSTGK